MIINALSVDLEEYYHAEMVSKHFTNNPESRVEHSTHRLLDLFDEHHVQATFFTLGSLAEKHPKLITEIKNRGHEIASHGQQHTSVYHLTEDDFYLDITKSKAILEDITGAAVLGYRAPNFSIVRGTEWSWAKIKKAGFVYDSSVYPISHDRYSNRDLPRFPYKITKYDLMVVPAATYEINLLIKKLRFPIAGGGYWRQLPLFFSKNGIKFINQREKKPAFCYLHPWEIDAEQPVAKGISFIRKLRHYRGLDTLESKLVRMFKSLKFQTYKAALNLDS